MAVILPSGRIGKGKSSAEAPSQLEQHLPKNAQALIAPLSAEDREVLSYMLAFGLLMVAELVLPASKLQWKPWKASSVKAGLKRDHAFPLHSLQSVSGRPQKASPFFMHKPSWTCDCFTCYSSFWSRWAASPNRDLLNTIIEIAELSGEGEQKASKGKEKKKKQEKKCAHEQESCGRKAKRGKWKLQNTPQTSETTSVPVNMVEATSITEIVNDTVGSTSMDVMYDALWDNVSADASCIFDGSAMLSEGKRSHLLPCRTEVDAFSSVSTMNIRSSKDAILESSPWVSSKQGRDLVMVQDELDGGPVTQASSPGSVLVAARQGKNNLKLQRAGKCKSNQITPLLFEGLYDLAEEEQDSNVSNAKAEASPCLRLADANLRGKGFLSCIFPDAVCGIASRLWDLVSVGSRNHALDYY